MPVHDWTRVDAGIFHAFHHDWITEISRTLNGGLLPSQYYTLPEQQDGVAQASRLWFAPAGRRCHTMPSPHENDEAGSSGGAATIVRTRAQSQFTAETEGEFYRRKKSSVVVRHVSGDRIVAMLEIISPGNKSSGHALRAFVEKACELLEHRIHLLIVDPFPPGPRDLDGIHAAIWQEVQNEPFVLPKDKPLTLAAYECGLTTRAYIEAVAVGMVLPDMPLFLEPNGHIKAPLEATYETAFEAMPRRWRAVLESEIPSS